MKQKELWKTKPTTLRRGLSLLLALALLLTLLPQTALPAAAGDPVYSGTCGENLTWSFDPDTGVLTIEGSGAMTEFVDYSTNVPWVDYRTQITELSLSEGLTSICYYAFYGCTGLSSATLPEGIARIGSHAFSGCTGLAEITVKSFGCDINDSRETLGVPGTTIIYGYSKSTAQTYADQNGYSFVSLGSLELSGECGADGDNLLWTLNTETGLLSFTGGGNMYNYDGNYSGNNLAPWYPYRSCISSVIFPEGLTSIGSYAFYHCNGLTSVTFPEVLTSIGSFAFQFCTGLNAVSLPEGLTSIGGYAFGGCTGLTAVEFPDGLTSIGSSAFSGCTGLTSVTFPATLTSIGKFAFYSCTGLTSVAFPEGLRSIKEQAFSRCSGLTSVTLPATVTSIGRYAFYECDLTEVVIKSFQCVIASGPATLGIGDEGIIYGYTGSTAQAYAEEWGFNFSSLGSIEVSGECGAYGDNLLWTLNLETGVLTIEGSGAMKDYYNYNAPWNRLREQITELSLPEGLTSIGSNAFYGCTGLTSIAFPEGLASIASYAFYGCTGLTSVPLPEGLTSIGNYAFYGCTGLVSVSLPNSLTCVDPTTFANCVSLRKLVAPNPDCLINCDHLVAEYDDSGEDIIDYSVEPIPYTIGSPENTVIYGKHDAEKETAEPVTETVIWENSWDDREFTLHKRYIENYAKTYGYTFYATNVFEDVREGKYYEIPVAWAYGKGITSGKDETHFAPNETCTRGQVVTFLWNAMGKPAPTITDCPFVDVKPGKYYYDAMLWALETGVTSGKDDTHFAPNETCTRGQVVTFIWNAMGKPEPTITDCPFVDVKPGKYYYNAMLWALENGVTSGTDATHFGPNQTCTRGQVVTFLYNALS